MSVVESGDHVTGCTSNDRDAMRYIFSSTEMCDHNY